MTDLSLGHASAGIEAPDIRARAESFADELGDSLRAGRTARNLSLGELARRVGITRSAISQIERGKSRPSISTLFALVRELNLSLDQMFASPDSPSDTGVDEPRQRLDEVGTSPEEDGRVLRSSSRKVIEFDSGVRWERLTPGSDPAVEFLLVVFEVGGASSPVGKAVSHQGHEYGVVLCGELEVKVGFDTHRLRAGDSIAFDSTLPHSKRNIGAVEARAIWCVVQTGGSMSPRVSDYPLQDAGEPPRDELYALPPWRSSSST